MMNKRDFFRLLQAKERLDTEIFDYWATRRQETNQSYSIDDLDFRWEESYGNNIIFVRTPFGDEEIVASDLYDKDDLKLSFLWHCGYYDGPMNGMALYNGQKVWFDMDEDSYDNIFFMRTYKIYELSDEDIEELETSHARFQRDVGYHTDYGEVYAPFEGVKNKPNFEKYYERAKKLFKKRKDFTKNKCLGTFDRCQFSGKRLL